MPFISGLELFEDVPGSGATATYPQDGTNFPAGMTLAEMIELRYRIKSWRLSGTVEWKIWNGADPGPSALYYKEIGQAEFEDLILQTSATDEGDLSHVKDSADWSATEEESGSYRGQIDSFDGLGQWRGFEDLTNSPLRAVVSLQTCSDYYVAGGGDYIPDAGTYVPAMTFSAAFYIGDVVKMVFSNGAAGPYSTDITFGGRTIKLAPSSYSVPGGFTLEDLSGSFSATPREWWPYDPEDGLGPVYAISTGNTLRDPFSVQARGATGPAAWAHLIHNTEGSAARVPLINTAG